MTWVKICGITNLEDALTAVDAGVDALGFVFYEKSPRRVAAEIASAIIQRLPNTVEKIGVFVNGSVWEKIEGIIKEAGLTGMQLQFGESNISACCAVAPESTKLYLTLPAEQIPDQEGEIRKVVSTLQVICGERPDSAVLLDSSTREQPGGTGKVFDWGKSAPAAKAIRSRLRLIVAGGLTPSNVNEAIKILKPWGVDVSSGVEASPGKKDPEKVRAFVAAVRAAEMKTQ
jgi:phosphoribosylanthranilate isomerase